MKKASKPVPKTPAKKASATKKSSSKPKRKARGQSELAEVIARLDGIADKLAQLVDRLVELATSIEIRREKVIVESIAPGEDANVANEIGEE